MTVNSVRKQARLGRKLEQIHEGAKQVFLRDGFIAASVDDIAKAAGVSKATLYSYFPDKELMFQDSMQSIFDATGPGPLAGDTDLPVSEALPGTVVAISDWFCLSLQKQLFRLAMTEAKRFPKFTAEYWTDIERKVTIPLRDQLRLWAERGELIIDDTETAAQNLIAMCEAYRHIPAKPGQKSEQTLQRRNAAENAAWIFLCAYKNTALQRQNLRFGTR